MSSTVRTICVLIIVLNAAACDAHESSTLPATGASSGIYVPPSRETKLWRPNTIAACPHPGPGDAECFALIRTGAQIAPDRGSGPNGGYTPAQLQSAYNLPSSTNGSGEIVAIVDAYDNPNITSDLAFYRSYFGLPAANFTKYNEKGQIGNYPSGSAGWGSEEDLDVDMVSATCPNCTIYLIEANSGAISDLEASVAEAVTLGAHIISNSYGCYGNCGFKQSRYDTPSVTYVAAAGDSGYGAGLSYPAGLNSVAAVGGTSLYVDKKSRRGFTERAWLGTTSGCATTGKKPSWQHDWGCHYRTGDDVAAVADVATGVAVYDTYGFNGWVVAGGTSASSPQIAGVFGLAGNATSQDGGKTFWEKEHRGATDLFHIEKGSDGSCTPAYLCKDGTHEYRSYGGPTGWGTPNGIGAF
ncbi:MAG: S8 family serine peptidase [Candidatus Cybelea sp.]